MFYGLEHDLLMNIPHELEKNVSSVVVGWNSVYTPIRSS